MQPGGRPECENPAAECGKFPKCAKLGLTGACCPNADGDYENCCYTQTATMTAPVDPEQGGVEAALSAATA